MAVILSDLRWLPTQLYHDGAALDGGATTITSQSAFFPGNFTYFYNDLAGSIRLRGVAAQQSWTSALSDGQTRSVWGTGLTMDAGKDLTGGMAAVLITADATGNGQAIIGVSVAVSALRAAAASLTGTDDAALLAQMLSGNDLAGLSGRNDRMASGDGIDLIFGNGGADALWLGAGMDCALGGRGDDTAHGQDGDDLLAGNQGQDRLFGEAGADMLDGGKGRDTLTGGAGGDTFVFLPGDGRDRITDFDADLDRLTFAVPGGQVSDVTLDSQGQDAVLTYQDTVIRLVGRSGLTLADIDIVFGFNTAESRFQTFVNMFDLKG